MSNKRNLSSNASVRQDRSAIMIARRAESYLL